MVKPRYVERTFLSRKRKNSREKIERFFGEKVFVYFNLHKKVFSIRSKKTNRVIAHFGHLRLSNATFRVSLAGQKRALREGTRNVHAGVEGVLEWAGDLPSRDWNLAALSPVSYHYRRGPFFFYKDSGLRVQEAHEMVILSEKVALVSR